MYFVSRWWEDSPFSKHVVAAPDATALGWFRRGWNREKPEAWIERELGGDVYGLDSTLTRPGNEACPRRRARSGTFNSCDMQQAVSTDGMDGMDYSGYMTAYVGDRRNDRAGWFKVWKSP